MVRLDSFKDNKRKGVNKENTSPSQADPYDEDGSQVMEFERLSVSLKTKGCRLKKASGRFLSSKSSSPPVSSRNDTLLAESTILSKRKSINETKPLSNKQSHPVASQRGSKHLTRSPLKSLTIPEKSHKLTSSSGVEKQSIRSSRNRMRNVARAQVFASKDMLLLIACYLPGMELVRLALANVLLQSWLGDPNHRLWHDLCLTRKFLFPKRESDSWKRRYLQSLAICEVCDHYAPSGSAGAAIACIGCKVQYCGFNPPPGHVRFPSSTPAAKRAPRKLGMCYEQCWALCWRCNDLIVMSNEVGQTGAVCRVCCPTDQNVCDQCRESILLAQTKPQWRMLGLADTSMNEFVELEDDNRSVMSYRHERQELPLPDDSLLETSSMFDPYL